MKTTYEAIDKVVDNILKYISIMCMAFLFVILIFNVFFRLVPILSLVPTFSMGWFDEIVELLFAWLIMTASSYLCKHGEHFRVDIIQMQLKGKRSLYILETVIDLITLVFYVGLMFYGYRLAAQAVQTTPVLMMQKKWMYSCIPINALLMVIFTLMRLCVHVRNAVHFEPDSEEQENTSPEVTE